MVQCSKCSFRTKYPGGKKCWQLEPPLCGDCAYALDHSLDQVFDKMSRKRVVKKFIKEEVIPIYLEFKQKPDFQFYKKTYVRKPSTKGGRFSQKNLKTGDALITQDGN